MAFARAFALLAILGSATAFAAVDPDYTLRFTPGVVGDPGTTVELSALLDILPGAGPVQGWSFGVCHDFTVVQPVAVAMGTALATIQGGNPPDFFQADFYAGDPAVRGGVTSAVVIDMIGVFTLPSGYDRDVLSITYSLVGPVGTDATLRYCDNAVIPGMPSPTPTILVVDGDSAIPTKVPGTIGIGLSPPDLFIRGDLDGDGNVALADAALLLGFLFAGGAPPACPEAGDIGDDDVFDLADPIALLVYLFAQGPPPAWPHPPCGVDPDAEAEGSECDDSGSYCEP